jgi:hypothetical protein
LCAADVRFGSHERASKRLKLSPVGPNDLRTLIDLGYVEMKNDDPVVTNAGLKEMEIGD